MNIQYMAQAVCLIKSLMIFSTTPWAVFDQVFDPRPAFDRRKPRHEMIQGVPKYPKHPKAECPFLL